MKKLLTILLAGVVVAGGSFAAFATSPEMSTETVVTDKNDDEGTEWVEPNEDEDDLSWLTPNNYTFIDGKYKFESVIPGKNTFKTADAIYVQYGSEYGDNYDYYYFDASDWSVVYRNTETDGLLTYSLNEKNTAQISIVQSAGKPLTSGSYSAELIFSILPEFHDGEYLVFDWDIFQGQGLQIVNATINIDENENDEDFEEDFSWLTPNNYTFVDGKYKFESVIPGTNTFKPTDALYVQYSSEYGGDDYDYYYFDASDWSVVYRNTETDELLTYSLNEKNTAQVSIIQSAGKSLTSGSYSAELIFSILPEFHDGEYLVFDWDIFQGQGLQIVAATINIDENEEDYSWLSDKYTFVKGRYQLETVIPRKTGYNLSDAVDIQYSGEDGDGYDYYYFDASDWSIVYRNTETDELLTYSLSEKNTAQVSITQSAGKPLTSGSYSAELIFSIYPEFNDGEYLVLDLDTYIGQGLQEINVNIKIEENTDETVIPTEPTNPSATISEPSDNGAIATGADVTTIAVFLTIATAAGLFIVYMKKRTNTL